VIIRGDPREAELVTRRWSWPGAGGKPVYNFRSDGRNLATGRCLIPVDGYYEWKTVGKLKVPYYFKRMDGDPLILAGLWSTQIRSDGETKKSLCLLTTKPNREAAQVHSRMPVIISYENQKSWLSDQPLSQSSLDLISATPVAGLLNLHRVSSEVNLVAIDKPELINPVVGQLDQPDFLGDLLGES
jgi:putative SOS response-associated peptidase YedK